MCEPVYDQSDADQFYELQEKRAKAVTDEQVTAFAELIRDLFSSLSHAPEFGELDEARYNEWLNGMCAKATVVLERMPKATGTPMARSR